MDIFALLAEYDHDETLAPLEVRIVAGGANNRLAERRLAAALKLKRTSV
ncbi:MAG: hypothetical protein HY705_05745 [Gemmatimonadetes bacterium]|nr:hypothetical protein [Gemmatimonadota bacterium]